jgi:hypothetical protein
MTQEPLTDRSGSFLLKREQHGTHRLDRCILSTRRDLEEGSWNLTSRLAELTTRLVLIVGRDHHAFLDALDECQTTALEITQFRVDLQERRQDHGC